MKRSGIIRKPKRNRESSEDRERYRTMVPDCGATCWNCGRTANQRPRWWHAPWLIERAHIVNQPRVERREVCLLLCSLCHKVDHGERFAELPHLEPLTMLEKLRTKKRFDPDFYDEALLQKCSVRRLPIA
jgi:hypothetical protein